MTTLKQIYNDLKNGCRFKHNNQFIEIGTDARWSSPSYGKSYIFYESYGSSALNVNYKDFCWIVHTIFGLRNAKEFNEYFERY